MPKYIVQEVPVRSGGTLHPPGAEIELAERAAEPLIALGRLEPAGKPGKSSAKAGASSGSQGGGESGQS